MHLLKSLFNIKGIGTSWNNYRTKISTFTGSENNGHYQKKEIFVEILSGVCIILNMW